MSGSEGGPNLDAYISRRRRRLMAGILLVLLAAALPIALLVSSRAFELAVSPPKAAATAAWSRVEGRLLILGSRVMLFSRKGTVALQAQGFAPRSIEIEKNSERQQIPVTLEPLPGSAVITVDSPVEFDLSVDEVSFGAAARVEVELERGPHTVRIRGSRIKPVTREIDVAGYGEIERFAFATEPGNSMLAVKTVPADAQVFLDGAPVGRGGFEGRLDLGDHEIAVRLDGYHDQHRRFTAEPEQRIDLGSIELLPKPATLAVASTPSGAAVLVDGEFAGSTPVRISLQPLRTQRLVIRKAGYEPVEARLEPKPGEIIERAFRLGSQTWRASVTSDIEARVSVNGIDRGFTPAAVTVSEGDRIEVSREGYQPQWVTVDPVGGEERAYAFRMMRPAEYAFDQAEAEISLANGIVLRKFPPVRFVLGPVHGQARPIEKALTRPFYMGLREVAYKEYLVFDAQPVPRGLSPEHPVANLTWAEAARYCNWLSGREGYPPVYEFDPAGELRRVATGSLGYRLPTEAEWEAVTGYDIAGGRLVGPFPWGEAASIPRAFGNFAGRENDGQGPGNFLLEHVDNHTGVAPVSSYPANFNGLYDLAGNVAEWVTDYHAPLPQQTAGLLIDPLGPARGIDHVVKGSSFRSGELSGLAVAHRSFVAGRSDAVGFRIARWIY
ncbi:MAG: PEGA domain-containing protein [Gammaproteobacteria bacterium]|nr:PEGA domain-containing protein [Gammaproteobacteria bacterium]